MARVRRLASCRPLRFAHAVASVGSARGPSRARSAFQSFPAGRCTLFTSPLVKDAADAPTQACGCEFAALLGVCEPRSGAAAPQFLLTTLCV